MRTALVAGVIGAVVCTVLAGPIAAGVLVTTLAGLAVLFVSVERTSDHSGARRWWRGDDSTRLLAAAAEHADELMSIVTAAGDMAHANRAFCRALGCERDVVARRKAREFLAEQSQSSIEAIEETARLDGVWRGTLVRRRQDGTAFLSSATVTALAADAGPISHFVVVERDVTRETALREQLTHGERLAAAGQLVSGVAHELNNPLQSIIGFTELLIESERREETKTDLEQVQREAHRAARIVRNLLAFVRRSAVERSVVSLNDLVRATVDLRRYELATSNIEVQEEYAENLATVAVNKEEIQQVLLNLLLNAEQAMQKTRSPGRLTIRTAGTPQAVLVEVHDSGPGVPPSTAARIFEPFFSTKEVGKGTGLGLSIALGIAQAHGGTLTLVPSPVGARFQLTLPARADGAVPAAQAAQPATTQATQPATTQATQEDAEASSWTAVSGRRALVADDEVPLRQLLRRLLTRRGFAVDVAEDGMQAANLIAENRYDVVLCDVQMPRMSGTALYQTIQRRQPGVAASFIMVSGDILNSELESFVAQARIPLLAKPFGAKSLDAALEQVMNTRVPRGA